MKRRELFQTLAPERRRPLTVGPRGLSREEAQALASRIMELSAADETEAWLEDGVRVSGSQA